jgi:hypothetical protein
MTDERAQYFEDLKRYLIGQPWHQHCEFIPAYVAPRAPAGTRSYFAVRYNDGTEYPPMLRHSAGPLQGFFWDIYGDDMQNMALAILALSQAPYPRNVGPITFTLPIRGAYPRPAEPR